MPRADQPHTTPTRRVFLSGATASGAALLAARTAHSCPDADLLEACARYHRAHAIWNGHYISDEMTDYLGGIRQTALEAVTDTQHHTPAGLRAKASVALSATLFDAETHLGVPLREQASAEQMVVIDVLRGFLGEG